MRIEECLYCAVIVLLAVMPLPAIHCMVKYWMWDQHLERRTL